MFRALFVIAVAVFCMSGCRPWQQAEQVLHTADSLDAQGVIYRDTAAFQSVILTYDRPVVRCLKHSDLGKAYYYLGRNYEDYHQRYLAAAKCYTRSDQCHMSDPIMRGRVNFAISNIYRMSDEDSLALEYGQYATNLYLLNKDTTLYIHGLLSLAQIHRNIKNNHIADSLLQSVAHYPLDETCRQRLAEQRGFYYYFLHEYDSALLYIRDAIRLQKSAKTIWYDYHLLMLTHYRLTNLDSAVYYAERIMDECPDIYALTANACYVLMEQCERNNDTNTLAYYAHLRADLQKESDLQKEECRIGAQEIQQYATRHRRQWVMILFIVLLLLLICYVLQSYHKLNSITQQYNTLEKKLDSTSYQLEKSKKDRNNVINMTLQSNKAMFSSQSIVWSDDVLFCKMVDEHLCNLYSRLSGQYDINVQDLKICILTLYNTPRAQIAHRIRRAVSSIPKLRSNTAKKMGVSATQLRTFLIDFLVS